MAEKAPDDQVIETTKESSKVGPIAGGVIGGVAAICLILGGIWYRRRRQRKKSGALAGEAAEETAHENQIQELPHESLPYGYAPGGYLHHGNYKKDGEHYGPEELEGSERPVEVHEMPGYADPVELSAGRDAGTGKTKK